MGDSLYSKARTKFFDDIYEAIKTHINFAIVKVVLVGSPGFLKDDFMEYLMTAAVQRGDVEFLHNKSKFVKSHASSGHKKSIEEVLADSALRGQLGDVRAADEMKALECFYQVYYRCLFRHIPSIVIITKDSAAYSPPSHVIPGTIN